MKIVPVILRDVFATYCYFVVDEENGHCFLIDCGAQGEEVVELVREKGWTLEAILLTHGHFDHTGGISAVQRELHTPVHMHDDDEEYLTDTYLNLSRQNGRHVVVHNVELYSGNREFALSSNPEIKLRCLHLPGHTPGSVTYYCPKEGVAFVGDTIFRDAPGIYTFPGGNKQKLMESTARILDLPPETKLYPGHTAYTTVEHERRNYM